MLGSTEVTGRARYCNRVGRVGTMPTSEKTHSRNCLENRDGSRFGAPKAVNRDRRSPDQPFPWRQEARPRRLWLFSKQFRKVGSAKLNFHFTAFYSGLR